MNWLQSVFSDKATLCYYSGQVASLLTLLAILSLFRQFLVRLRFLDLQSRVWPCRCEGKARNDVQIFSEAAPQRWMCPGSRGCFQDALILDSFHSLPADEVMVCRGEQEYVKALGQAWGIWPLRLCLSLQDLMLSLKKIKKDLAYVCKDSCFNNDFRLRVSWILEVSVATGR